MNTFTFYFTCDCQQYNYCLLFGVGSFSFRGYISILFSFLLIQVFEGYGQTETTAGATISLPGDFSVGHVGAPLACNLIKLVDVPEMDYYSKNLEGEVRKKEREGGREGGRARDGKRDRERDWEREREREREREIDDR